MKEVETEQHVKLGSLMLLALFAGLTFFVVSIMRANLLPAAASDATFRAKCATCHGEDGGGSEVGKSMNALDLRSAAVQKLSDAELAQVISDGKGGMPPFKNSLSEQQMHELVSYTRSLQHPARLLRGRQGILRGQ